MKKIKWNYVSNVSWLSITGDLFSWTYSEIGPDVIVNKVSAWILYPSDLSRISRLVVESLPRHTFSLRWKITSRAIYLPIRMVVFKTNQMLQCGHTKSTLYINRTKTYKDRHQVAEPLLCLKEVFLLSQETFVFWLEDFRKFSV